MSVFFLITFLLLPFLISVVTKLTLTQLLLCLLRVVFGEIIS